jgi:hypothetical protein
MKKNLFLTCLFFTCFFAKAQLYNYVNDASLSGSTFYSCVATNSGYVFAGTANNLAFESHLFFARTTTGGTVQQMRSFTAGGYSFSCAIQTTDGNFAYYGTEINSSTFIGSLVLLKLDIVGNYLITKTYSDPDYSFTAKKTVQDAQGNFYLFATAFNNQTFQSSMCLIVTDPSGNITSQKLFSPGFSMDAMDIISTSGSGILLTGYASNGASIENIVLIKLNASLNIDWSKWFTDASLRYFHYDIKEKSSGNFILCGRYDNTVDPYSTLIMEIDNAGNQVWAKTYPSADTTSSHGYSLVLTSSGAAVVGGGIDTAPGLGPVLAMSVDAGNGNLNWSKVINSGATQEIIYEMQLTSGGEIIACGSRNGKGTMHKVNDQFDNCVDQSYPVAVSSVTLSFSPINPAAIGAGLVAGNWTATPVTHSSIADACFGIGVNEVNTSSAYLLYPNPVKDHLNISSEWAATEIKVYDAMGKLVLDLRELAAGEVHINTSTLKNGIYNIQLISNKKIITAKFSRVE